VLVRDDGIGLTEVAGQGVGLANIHERLSLLYGKEASLSVSPGADLGVEAVLSIPLPLNRE
jgi:LytS/YehU family sensor histidine kinase